ncbi:MAG: hypothetical protein K9M36_02495 [Candidatus Pacebacteria bacterium]|nr:hypothetical protein [Candidatus Paceibacterota bacterium]
MIIKIIFFILLADSIIANVIAFLGKRWYVEHFQILSRWLPMSKIWTMWYLMLVLWIGWLTFNL